MRLVLGSRSAVRAALLRRAGYRFEQRSADLDETAMLEAARKDADRDQHSPDWDALAVRLAKAKAAAVADVELNALVIGADQLLVLDGAAYETPRTKHAAAERLRRLSGKTHELVTAAALRRGSTVVWSNVERTRVGFRALSDRQISQYLEAAGEVVTTTVGGYAIEGLGARLIERVDGDHFAALGLPLFPLIAALSAQGVDPLSSTG